ncbi:hypothetical protein CXG81DRAFT_19068 [Caulochytrium protostelioides]|uniref:Ribosomal protein S19e n=1 Tax=Caulochytrium protostelioides TaxID=1555241 RepID=A0A4P9X777_9FUNG|nr:ribosomal protein S19e [Caulochytrium protostelioides]RKP01073.1 hypothetical protein CXG81DRAFT_19068 [Caulochytrium protostelioides]|eukprot:RKP01073.1 hypothetical protein CXG81DRAFT_19068 [Caulochytrium protostelioides]
MSFHTVKDVSAHKFIEAYSAYLKRTGKLEVPKWVDLVKTASYKELAPIDPDWYFVRAAAVARHVYLRPGTSVLGLRKHNGGRKNRGSRPEHYALGSGAVDRAILKSLEAIKIVETTTKGRVLTSTGQRDLNRIATQVASSA